MHLFSEWSRMATQNNKTLSVTTSTTPTPNFSSRSSSLISDVTNSSGMFTGCSLHSPFYLDNTAGVVLWHYSAVININGYIVVLPQALCLQTAEYLTASAAMSSSMRFTGKTCQ